MRPLLAIFLVCVILGGMKLYMVWRDERRPVAVQNVETTASGTYSLQITPTFDVQAGDPFALDPTDAPSVLVLFRGKQLLRRTEPVAAGELILITPIHDMMQGGNEFYINLIPAEHDSDRGHAVHVRAFRDEHPIAETTLWSDPGQAVQGKIVVEILGASGSKH